MGPTRNPGSQAKEQDGAAVAVEEAGKRSSGGVLGAEEVVGRGTEKAALSLVKPEVVRTVGSMLVVLDGPEGMGAVGMVTGLTGDGTVMEALKLAQVWVAQERLAVLGLLRQRVA